MSEWNLVRFYNKASGTPMNRRQIFIGILGLVVEFAFTEDRKGR